MSKTHIVAGLALVFLLAGCGKVVTAGQPAPTQQTAGSVITSSAPPPRSAATISPCNDLTPQQITGMGLDPTTKSNQDLNSQPYEHGCTWKNKTGPWRVCHHCRFRPTRTPTGAASSRTFLAAASWCRSTSVHRPACLAVWTHAQQRLSTWSKPRPYCSSSATPSCWLPGGTASQIAKATPSPQVVRHFGVVASSPEVRELALHITVVVRPVAVERIDTRSGRTEQPQHPRTAQGGREAVHRYGHGSNSLIV